MNIDREIWIIVKVFPKVNTMSVPLFSILTIKPAVLFELKNIIEKSKYYFVHYTDAPEGAHFKFAFNNKTKLKEILDWKLTKLGDENIQRIEILIEESDESKTQANLAREVVESITLDKESLLKSISATLNSDPKYNALTEEGKHLVRNMLGLTYQEEAFLRTL